ncbi:MAG TPA: hypothetical protein VMV94_21755, partial [Phycisphaerae bacterium]|nr:hypothetical protein [Phycisphaerae bacterium]
VDGATWTTIWVNPTTQSDNYWLLMKYDISAVADNHATVYVRWGMGPTDEFITYPGWNIDDVELWGVAHSTCTGVLLGDADGNGVVDGRDIQRFVEVLINPYSAGVTVEEFCAVDTDADGFITRDDLNGFVQELLNP